jgi:hypothetical protein
MLRLKKYTFKDLRSNQKGIFHIFGKLDWLELFLIFRPSKLENQDLQKNSSAN